MKKPNGTGNLYRRKEIWWVKIYVDGKPVYASTKSTNVTDAKIFRDKMIAKKVRGELSGSRQGTVLIDELLNDVLKSDIAESTRYTWNKTTEAKLRPFFGSIKAARLTSEMIEEYREKRVAEGLTHATVNRHLTILRTAYNNARKRGKVRHTPYFPMRAETTVRQGFLTDDNYVKLKNAIAEPELRLLFVIAYFTGVRKNELLQIKWSQVDLESGFIDLNPGTTKNGEGRSIPIVFGDMMNLLTAAKKVRDDLFPCCEWLLHRSGKRVKSFRKAWAVATKMAGVPGLLFHDLRRTACRNMRRDGVPQIIRMKITGHRTDSMERRYNIVDNEDLVLAKQLMGLRNRNVTVTGYSG